MRRILLFMSIFSCILVVSNSLTTSSNDHKQSNLINDKIKVPSFLNVGDILFCDMKEEIVDFIAPFDGFITIRGYSNDHCALYIGNNRFVESAPYRIRPMRLNFLGVVISPFWKIKLWADNITFGYVDTSQDIRDASVKWALRRIGSPYQFFYFSDENPNPYDSNDMYSNRWSCGELIWAAYWNQNFPLYVDYGYHVNNATSPRGLRTANKVVMYNNEPPISDVGGPYYGDVDRNILFEGWKSTDIDGRIVNFTWDFDDGTFGYDEFCNHIFKKAGVYNVTLIVTDNGGKQGFDSTEVVINKVNRPPSDPKINGPSSGYVNLDYNFNISSLDIDNDSLKYTIFWDDGIIDSSNYLMNGTSYNINHSWRNPDVYSIRVEVTDNITYSQSTMIIDINEDNKNNEGNTSDNERQNNFNYIIIFIILCICLILIIKYILHF